MLLLFISLNQLGCKLALYAVNAISLSAKLIAVNALLESSSVKAASTVLPLIYHVTSGIVQPN